METKNEGVFGEIEATFGQVPTWIRELPPETLGGFWSTMRDFQLAETRIPNKYKELIGIGVAGATRCRYCAFFHAEAARFFGASEEEIREASAMAAHTMGASTFLNGQLIDYETFREQTREMLEYVRAREGVEAPSKPGPDFTAHA